MLILIFNMKKISTLFLLGIFISGFPCILSAQKKTEPVVNDSTSAAIFTGLKFRSIGPAFMSGRIADVAIHPQNNNIWYVAVGSGGVWKTVNSGTTWIPVFDSQKSYSIGCIAIDPSNPNTVWAGTGENVGGRHVGYGDGIYRSDDGGMTWKNMGLIESQHISEIIIHPSNSNIVWVAVQGPLWSKGGERGLYLTTDGGKTWQKTLGDDAWTGVTDIMVDPSNPNRIYAATWQHGRTVASYIGGGPGTAIYRSEDGGLSWEKLTNGLPASGMGKIGLAMSFQKPDVVYAAIELDRRTGAVYRSEDRGASWKKMSDVVSGATGPHYYQELYASPHKFDRIYLIDVRIQVSEDGGKTFQRLTEQKKHSDNHCIAFRKDDPDYLLIGTDGGLYESFDLAVNWRYIGNLPVTQFYKVAVDDAEPFYHIYGGTQDNATQGGPSRTDDQMGIRNSDWFITLGGDGHQPATEPGNPNIIYSQAQEGELHRIDMITGEKVYIKPQPGAGESYERNNWDSPILISPHNPATIYFASQRVWRSDNRGDSWTAISGDLTRNQDRMLLKVMDKTWSWDAPWDYEAMSNYNTITSLAESPVQKGLIYAGTDDGLIQVTEDGGVSWRKIEVGSMAGVPATAFVNDIKTDLFDANTVYVVLDNHKYGDLNPYLVKSTDKGKTWTSIRGNFPDRTLLWRIVQDHIVPELMFAGTEFGIWFTADGGKKWIQLKGGLPTISFRDLAIQRRENDLVGASFGRGFYILDDYSCLREIKAGIPEQESLMFPVRKALWYIPKSTGGSSLGASWFTAPNPLFGAEFTYYLKEPMKTLKVARTEEEQKLKKEGKDVAFPGWDAIDKEKQQEEPGIWLIIKDSAGNVVRKLKGINAAGLQRVTWDLRMLSGSPVDLDDMDPDREPAGYLVVPGTYTVTLTKLADGVTTFLTDPVAFEVVPLRDGALEGRSFDEIAAFREEIEKFSMAVTALDITLNKDKTKIDGMQKILLRTPAAPGVLDSLVHQLRQDLIALDEKFNGNSAKLEIGEKTDPTIRSRMNVAMSGARTTYGPTPMHKQSLEIAKSEYEIFRAELADIHERRIPEVEKRMTEAGAPWMEGLPIPE
jgi:photosystem II stability/assembly factor-like uncharacterized protein